MPAPSYLRGVGRACGRWGSVVRAAVGRAARSVRGAPPPLKVAPVEPDGEDVVGAAKEQRGLARKGVRRVVQVVAEARVAALVVAEVRAVQPNVAGAKDAVKVHPHGVAAPGRVDRKVAPVPADVSREVAVALERAVVNVRSFDYEVVRHAQLAPRAVVKGARLGARRTRRRRQRRGAAAPHPQRPVAQRPAEAARPAARRRRARAARRIRRRAEIVELARARRAAEAHARVLVGDDAHRLQPVALDAVERQRKGRVGDARGVAGRVAEEEAPVRVEREPLALRRGERRNYGEREEGTRKHRGARKFYDSLRWGPQRSRRAKHAQSTSLAHHPLTPRCPPRRRPPARRRARRRQARRRCWRRWRRR